MKRAFLILPFIGLAACATNPDGSMSSALDPAMCSRLHQAVALAELNGFTEIDLNGDGRALTLDQARMNLAVLCPAEAPA